MNPTSFLCGNRNGHHNMELKTKQISNTDTTKNQGSTRVLVKGMLHVSTKPGERESGHVYVCLGYRFYLCVYDFPRRLWRCFDIVIYFEFIH